MNSHGGRGLIPDNDYEWQLLNDVNIAREHDILRLFWSRSVLELQLRSSELSEGLHNLLDTRKFRLSEFRQLLENDADVLFGELQINRLVIRQDVWSKLPHEDHRGSVGYLTAVTPNPLTAWEQLRLCRLVIVGLGGIGSRVLCDLAGLGMRHFCLVDGGRVSAGDADRQPLYLGTPSGVHKAEAAKQRLRTEYRDLEVESFAFDLLNVNELGPLGVSPDFIVWCADSVPLVDVYRSARIVDVPIITSGVLIEDGFAGPLIDGNTPCYDCFLTHFSSDMLSFAVGETGKRHPTRAALPALSGIVASIIAVAVSSYLLRQPGALLGERLTYYLRGSVEKIALPPDVHCAHSSGSAS